MPFRIEPIACSRMPKCRTRPYGRPVKYLDWRSSGRNDGSPLMVVLLDSGQVGGTAPQLGQHRGDGGERRRRTALRVAMPLGSGGNVGRASSQPSGSSRRLMPVEQRRALGVGGRPGVEAPSATRRAAPCRGRRPRGRGRGPRRRPGRSASGSKPRISLVAATSSAPSAEPWAFPVFCASGAGQAMTRAEPDERRTVGRPRRAAVERRGEGVRRPRRSRRRGEPVDELDVPAVAPRSGRRRPRDRRDRGVVLDGDVVVVVRRRTRLPSPCVAGDRRGLVADALLDVAVGGEAPDHVVERALAGGGLGVEQAALAAGRHGHADGVADALAERPGGRLDARGVPVLGVAGRQGAPRAERLEVVELEAVAGQVQLDVEREARVAAGQHEAVAAQPVGVARVVAQEPLPEQVRRRRQAHRRAGVAVADLLDGVHGQDTHRVDRSAVEIGPVDRAPIPCCHLRLCSRVVLPSAAGCDSSLAIGWAGRRPCRQTRASEVCVTAVDPRSSHRSSPLRVPPSPVAARHRRCLRRPHQAAHHRAPAGHHGAHHDPRRAGGLPRASAGPRHPRRRHAWRPPAPTRSTASTTATSTGSCTAPERARSPPARSRSARALVFGLRARRRWRSAGWP